MFVRQDIPIEHQIVQSCHAALTMGSQVIVDGIPNIVLIGVPSLKSLERVQAKLDSHGIEYRAWTEPDFNLGFTSIATEPLTKEQKTPLANYRLWKSTHAGSSEKERPVLAGGSVVQVHPGVPACAHSSIGRAADSNSVGCGFDPH